MWQEWTPGVPGLAATMVPGSSDRMPFSPEQGRFPQFLSGYPQARGGRSGRLAGYLRLQ